VRLKKIMAVCLVLAFFWLSIANANEAATLKTLKNSQTAMSIGHDASLAVLLRQNILQTQAGANDGLWLLFIFPQLVNALLFVAVFFEKNQQPRKHVFLGGLHLTLALMLYQFAFRLDSPPFFIGYCLALACLFLRLYQSSVNRGTPRGLLIILRSLGIGMVLYIGIVLRVLMFWLQKVN
jgi:hypothetical protein